MCSQNCEKRLLASSRLFVRLSDRMEQLGSHRTLFMTFNISVFFENLSTKFKFLWNLTRITGTLHDNMYFTWHVLYMTTCTLHGNVYFTWQYVLYMTTCTLYDNMYFTWQRVLYMTTRTYFWSYLAQFFLKWKTFHTNS